MRKRLWQPMRLIKKKKNYKKNNYVPGMKILLHNVCIQSEQNEYNITDDNNRSNVTN